MKFVNDLSCKDFKQRLNEWRMSKLFRAFHNREHNDFSIVEKIRPSSCPAFWHVKVISSKDKAKIGQVLHVAEDMLSVYKPEPILQ